MRGIQVEIIKDENRFSSLKPQWNKLVDQNSGSSIFLYHEWFDSAWQWCCVEGAKLWILIVWEDSILIGICPLIQSIQKIRTLSLSVIEFLSIPDTQLNDVIIAPKKEEIVASTLANWFIEYKSTWDLISLGKLPTPANASFLQEVFKELGYYQSVKEETRNHFIALKGSWNSFYKDCSRRMKKGNNLAANRLTHAGEIKLEWIRESSQVKQMLQSVINLSILSWKKKELGALNKEGPLAFIKRLTEHGACSHWVSIWILYLDNIPTAYEYQLIHKDNIYALRSDYDTSKAWLSPGTYLNWKIIEQLFQQSLIRYYFGPGDNAYKLRWTETAEPLKKICIYNRNVTAHIFYCLEEQIIPKLRYLRNLINKQLLHN
ncbi:GNAT family N-acetyltransferase [Candidatus Nitrosacidococcus tergens]|uniref:Putative Cellulose biosynthesis-like protein n=1 Tax=Candidatus Nitrosacidococcus tergens TaxID=553981 RepID=A0A7G1QBN3_9GAMM|nr:GNAT family N-acetyltransferase [Candidatus Nitrosacidococcus tergens]CAB1276757.1 putative Cellulose biosynthesis-like protein [Candidatus Nitrosacidococcus tergens]